MKANQIIYWNDISYLNIISSFGVALILKGVCDISKLSVIVDIRIYEDKYLYYNGRRQYTEIEFSCGYKKKWRRVPIK